MKYRIWNKTLNTWGAKGNTTEIIESEDKEYEFEMRSYPEDNDDRELEIYKDVFNPEESDLDYFLRRQKEMREGKVTPEEEFYIKDLTKIIDGNPL